MRSHLNRNADDDGAKFCTLSSLKGLFNVVGPLRALVQVDSVLMLVCERVHLLAQIAEMEGPETARLAAETVCYALACKWKARQVLAADKGLLRLCALLQSRATQVSFCGAAAISLLMRERQGRSLIAATDSVFKTTLMVGYDQMWNRVDWGKELEGVDGDGI